MKMKRIAVFLLAICMLALFCACGSAKPASPDVSVPDTDTGGSNPSDTPGDYFARAGEAVAQWAASVSEQNPPAVMIVSWGNVGGVIRCIYDDRALILSTFNSLSALHLGAEQGEADDNSIGITFVMRDGTEQTLSFNDGHALIYENGAFKCYSIDPDADLAALFKKMTGHRSGENYRVTLAAGEKFAVSCPEEAEGGSPVTLSLFSVTDGELRVYVNGYRLPDDCFTDECTVTFMMPFNDVEIKVVFSDEGFGGA